MPSVQPVSFMTLAAFKEGKTLTQFLASAAVEPARAVAPTNVLSPASLPVALTPGINTLLALDCVVAIGVSGGKDSDACALAVCAYLDKIGHAGPRVLIHADLGVVEWKDSGPSCDRLAAHLGVELLTVRRQAGDMMDRWEGRWKNNVARYNDMSCMKSILPWSTPSMRFCTSELKAAVISSALRKRFPTQDIVSVTGIRRQESHSRAKMPVYALDKRLTRKDAVGATWNAIIEWPIEQVFESISDAGLRLHEAYTKYGASRVSCAFCIMSSSKDLLAAAGCADNHDLYRRMVTLEAASTFAFQSGKWLADAAPHLLDAELLARVVVAKARASVREQAERELPAHLLYIKGWPPVMPTPAEAELIAGVRRKVSEALGLDSICLTGREVMARFEDLMAQKALKDNAKPSDA